MQPDRIILVGGQTAGHILPLIAVAQEYRRRDRDVVVFGQSAGPEAQMVPQYGFTFKTIAGAPLHGVSRVQHARAYWSLGQAFWQAHRMLAGADAALVAGFGGYVSAAPILAARSLGIATAVYEANAIPGIANRRLGHIADLRLAGLEATKAHAAWRDAVVSGHPIRREVLDVARRGAQHAGRNALRVLVTAGLRGSPFLNKACPALLAFLQQNGSVVIARHQAGSGDARTIALAYQRSGVQATVEPFIDDMGAAFERSDLVICAGGAGTLSEIAALGLPAVVVPIDGTADDHQNANAAAFAGRLRAIHVGERDWDVADVARRIAALLTGRSRPTETIRTDAAALFVQYCEGLIARRRPQSVRHPAREPIEHSSS
jgi:UDP-N-acetylglucosamine--N-acetylmuramyl-(pentapeptide) pyrophosphoryl-undecaprenol N-acetylglucosamine transferase